MESAVWKEGSSPMLWSKKKTTISELQDQILSLKAEVSFIKARELTDLRKLIKANEQKEPLIKALFELQIGAYSISENIKWSVEKEVRFVEGILSLWNQANAESQEIKKQFLIHDPQLQIYPLITVPPIINALVNGYNSMKEHPVKIKFQCSSQHLQVEVSNRVNHYLEDQANNLEMMAFKDRLLIRYAENQQLFINSNSNLFKTTLILSKL
ncbi:MULTISPECIES: hypothetical protein [Sphingobacterium]|uniref:Uncharacterized protein n=1 Tax=Sphingobacterium tenebrionis TaxID=3111775 RepID=A0ABU8I7J0_9SPHI|nr:hypothetical protein [Sphingobacterium sp. CZ-2]QBR11379.1 hypothetical protein E3D81_03970 [Sphingobacterium sp. CZ-2]